MILNLLGAVTMLNAPVTHQRASATAQGDFGVQRFFGS
jgi:hypothetical protein